MCSCASGVQTDDEKIYQNKYIRDVYSVSLAA